MRAPHILVALLSLLAAFSGCASEDDAPTAPDPGPVPPEEIVVPDDPRIIGEQPIELIFGGSIRYADAYVLLVPPAHGDLGNTDGPTFQDYLDATLFGLRSWQPAIATFVAENPQYSYLENITVHIEVFDGVKTERTGYDVVIGYIETSGPLFRGVASQPAETQSTIDQAGLDGKLRWGGRYILLSLFASAPRAGQDLEDWPEWNDMVTVTMHEFAHTWGLGHTTTWTAGFGPDLMNSPYPMVYGDGDPVGDGEERTDVFCISSLDLYGLAELYRWLPSGEWEGSSGMLESPLEYKVYCQDPEKLLGR